MNKARAKELLPIIEAFANGKTIEYLFSGEWRVAAFPDWNPGIKYRIKPDPKLVPFKFEDNLLFRDRWIYDKSNIVPGIMRIISYNDSNIHTEFKCIGYKYLLENYCFDDDKSPCGKYINE
jgi:hypothetical protein